MSNEENNPGQRHGQPDPYAGWQPTPQSGEYDAEATAFVHLDPDDLAGLGGDPLAAPGHGYVPPMILPLTPAAGLDPSATGSWVVRTQSRRERAAESEEAPGTSGAPEAVHWPDPNEREPYERQHYPDTYPHTYPDGSPGYEQTSSTTAQWNFTDSLPEAGPAGHPAPADQPPPAGSAQPMGHIGPMGHAEPTGHSESLGHTEPVSHTESSGHAESTGPTEPSGHPGFSGSTEFSDHSGQWTVRGTDGGLPEGTGEFAASELASSWYASTPPATLPGGAPAPWAEQSQEAPDQPRSAPVTPEPRTGLPGEHTGHAPQTDPPEQTGHAGPPAQTDEPAEAPREPREPQEAGEPQEAFAAPGAPALSEAPEASPVAEAPVSEESGAAGEPHGAGLSAEAPAPEQGPVRPTPVPAVEEPAADPVPDPATDPDANVAQDPSPDSAVAPLLVEPRAPEVSEAPAPADVPSAHPSATYALHVNGVDRPVSDAWIGESLLYVLRERLGLAGAKDGCSQGECGACNVQVDGRLVASCLVPAATTAGSEIRTVEGLAVDGEPSDIQRALAACGAVQCGFCIPGMAMTVHDLLEGNHAPSELETRQALCGNLCRCSGYRGVLDAVREVVEGRDTADPDDEEPRVPHQAPPGAGGVQPHEHEGDAR
ncbi:2Fe-2S iron-sulfur cluster-binding protein [Streptomyces sp. NBC_01754]|uniref:2Fe-2S iron-sulfur cluster-binding protein n=1 Tax=Streptomyces sp. NBC_01754 TaxID=2975930 RepID=UPI002DDBED21|nr:2Fe-2S iron-sulfur cluster-binding protein [Streptomyces sp. NBC_01754]WSC92725.1 2Fe-2S iron-sulfur cluster-binding protein [Streptomyces sp. NBC_01754]